MDENIRRLKEIVDGSDNIVFFGGAGVSTESGIPDFRSVDGLYNQKYKYPPEQILSHSFFVKNPEEYYRFHHEKLRLTGAKPNAAHLKLAEWERQGKLKAVITQNIDGLHQAAGSKNVLELHGTLLRTPTSCSMRSRWTTTSSPARSTSSARPTCSSSAGPALSSIPPRGLSTITAGISLSS